MRVYIDMLVGFYIHIIICMPWMAHGQSCLLAIVGSNLVFTHSECTGMALLPFDKKAESVRRCLWMCTFTDVRLMIGGYFALAHRGSNISGRRRHTVLLHGSDAWWRPQLTVDTLGDTVYSIAVFVLLEVVFVIVMYECLGLTLQRQYGESLKLLSTLCWLGMSPRHSTYVFILWGMISCHLVPFLHMSALVMLYTACVLLIFDCIIIPEWVHL